MAAPAGILGFLAVAEVIGDAVGTVIDQTQAAKILHRAIDMHMGKVEEVGAGIESDFAAEIERRKREQPPPVLGSVPPQPAPAPATPLPAPPAAPGGGG